MIEQRTGDALIKALACSLYSLPFFAVYGTEVVCFIREWKELFGSALGAAIGAAGAFYIGKRSNETALESALNQTRADHMIAELEILRPQLDNLRYHIVLIEEVKDGVSKIVGILEGNGSFQAVPMLVTLQGIPEVPQPLHIRSKDFNHSGYGDSLPKLRKALDALGSLTRLIDRVREQLTNIQRPSDEALTELIREVTYRARDACEELLKSLVLNKDILEIRIRDREDQLSKYHGYIDIFG